MMSVPESTQCQNPEEQHHQYLVLFPHTRIEAKFICMLLPIFNLNFGA
jgi:hypothetical protein